MLVFFFFKQKTAYEMRISDWSSDVCSSDLIRNELQTAVFPLRQSARVRLLLSPSGAVAIETTPLPPAAAGTVEAALVPLPVATSDFRPRHKTTSSDERRVRKKCLSQFKTRGSPYHSKKQTI